jgi:hypothetical protein
MYRTFPRLVALVIALAFLTGPASALESTLLVPQQFATIGEALQAASSTDTIIVAAGIYPECPVVTGLSSFTLLGKRGSLINAAGCDAGITINDGVDVTVHGLTVLNATTQGILVNAGASSVEIRKVIVQDSAADPAASLLQTGIAVEGANDVTINDVTIVGAKAQGVLVSSASRTVVKKSTIVDGVGNGVTVDLGTAISISKNVMENLDGLAVLFSHPGGMEVQGGAIESLVTLNKVIGGGGISIAGMNNLIEKNKLRGTVGAAIAATANGGASSYRKNTVLGAAGAGILAAGTADTFEKNTIKEPLDEGVEVVGTANTFTGVKVIKSAGSGFVFAPSATGNTCDDCASANAAADGFHVEGTLNTFVQCKSFGSGGLDVNDSAGVATTNTYIDCKFKTSNLP